MGGGRGGQALLLGTWGHWVVFPAPQLHPYRIPSRQMSPQMNFLQGWDLVGATRPEAGACRRGSRGLVALSCAFPRGLQRAVAPTRSAGGPGCSSRRAGSRPGQRHGPKSAVKKSEIRSASPCCLPRPSPLLGAEQQPREVSQEDLRLRVGATGPAHAVGCSWQEDVNLWAQFHQFGTQILCQNLVLNTRRSAWFLSVSFPFSSPFPRMLEAQLAVVSPQQNISLFLFNPNRGCTQCPRCLAGTRECLQGLREPACAHNDFPSLGAQIPSCQPGFRKPGHGSALFLPNSWLWRPKPASSRGFELSHGSPISPWS